ncbi:hypothetical protein J2X73_004378 [Novosphingobium sp. 1748]|nr:hypothetical protein [Novosphingobium sp. 1748]NKI99780.1 hypothetical protein [Novosphingobium sp. SG707]
MNVVNGYHATIDGHIRKLPDRFTLYLPFCVNTLL